MIIQRYMDLPKFLSLLSTKELFLSKMSNFEDKLEGGLTYRDFLEVSNSARHFGYAFDYCWPGANLSAEESQRRREDGEKIRAEIASRKFSTPFGEYPSDMVEVLWPQCRDWLYVNCWHKSEHECSAMWKLYGGTKNSICVFSTEQRLKDAVKNHKYEVHFGAVSYLPHQKGQLAEINAISPFMAKSTPYSFEKEYRILAWEPATDLQSPPNEETHGISIEVDLNQLIEKVVVSPDADSWFKSVIERLCASHGMTSQVIDSHLKKEPVNNFYQAMEAHNDNSYSN